LRDGGYLALGKTESISPVTTYFTPQEGDQKVYRRQGEHKPVPAFHREPLAPLPAALSRQNRQQNTSTELLKTQR